MASILKPEFKSAFELQYVGSNGAEFWASGDTIKEFRLTTGLKLSILNLHIERHGGYWQIVRASDGIVIAQSKASAPAALSADSAAPDDSALPFAEFDTSEDVYFENPEMRDDWSGSDWKPQSPDWKEVSQGTWIYKPSDNTPPPTHTTRLRIQGGGNMVTGHSRNKPRKPKPRNNAPRNAKSQDNGVQAVSTPITEIRRHSARNRRQASPMLERKTQAAKDWHKMRILHNATAVPIPPITGAELLQTAGLTLVPKARKLTRVLERAA